MYVGNATRLIVQNWESMINPWERWGRGGFQVQVLYFESTENTRTPILIDIPIETRISILVDFPILDRTNLICSLRHILVDKMFMDLRLRLIINWMK
jgi:hypothetical protein